MPHMAGPETSVDTPSGESVSFQPPSFSRDVPSPHRWTPVAVGPERPTDPPADGATGERMTGYPIRPAKVQRPPLRDETLTRDRLLDWLGAKIHQRVVLVLADAGYGK